MNRHQRRARAARRAAHAARRDNRRPPGTRPLLDDLRKRDQAARRAVARQAPAGTAA